MSSVRMRGSLLNSPDHVIANLAKDGKSRKHIWNGSASPQRAVCEWRRLVKYTELTSSHFIRYCRVEKADPEISIPNPVSLKGRIKINANRRNSHPHRDSCCRLLL